MTEEQLQLLRSLRPHGQDDHEAGVPEARAAAEKAGVSIHLDDERQTDVALRSALAQIEPPAGLEDAMRIAMRAARGIGEPPVELRESLLSAVRFPKAPELVSDPRMTRRRWLGWGAGIAASLAVGGKWWWDTRAFTVRKLTGEVTAITRKGISLTLMSMDKVVVGDWLQSNNAPRIDVLPEKLDALGRKGCHLYDIDGHPVSLECFLLPDMKQLHLYCTPSSGLFDPPTAGTPAEFVSEGDLTLAIWAKGEQTLLLISHESAELVRTLIA
jgi:hypothetical protein